MNQQRGFTLLEILVAMTLLGVIMVMAYGGLRAGTRASIKGEQVVNQTNQMRVAQGFIRSQIRRAMPLMIEVDDDEQMIVFEGDAQEMRFVAPMPGYLGTGGPHIQTLSFDGGNNPDLIFDHQMLSYEDDVQDDDERDPVLLLDHIERGKFSYLGLDEEGEIGEWEDEWEDHSTIPLLVKIEIEMDESHRLDWPELIISPLIDSTSRSRGLLGKARNRGSSTNRENLTDEELSRRLPPGGSRRIKE